MEFLVLIFLGWLINGGSKAPGSPPANVPPPFPGPAPIPQQPMPVPVPAPAPPPQPPAAAATYTIKGGDTPFGLAQRFVGEGKRWTELRPPNPELKTVQTRDDNGNVIATHLVPFNPGQVLKVPPGWPPTPAA